VDDHQLVRTGLRQLISAEGDLEVVGEARTANEALDLVRAVSIDVLLLDIGMPRQSGGDALSNISVRAPWTHILIHTG